MNSWNGLDFLIFLIFALNTILGMVRGSAKEIISMMCLCVALIFMIKFTVPLANFFNSSPLIVDVVDNKIIQNFMLAIGAGPMTASLLKEIFYSISILICFVGIFSICEAALTKTGFVQYMSFPYATIDRKLAAALGCTRGYVITLILLVILALHLLRGTDSSIISGSYFAKLFQGATIKLDQIITGQNPDQYRDVLQGKDLYNATDVMKALDTQPQNAPQPQNSPPAQP